MKRFHVHLNVDDLAASVRFYSALFASEPSVRKHDYAKWMLEDPRLNFAISSTGRGTGIDHLGLQAEDAAELSELGLRLHAAGGTVLPEPGATCCYARSDKAWTIDPQGTRWETFHTHGESTSYHAGDSACGNDAAACAPLPAAALAKADASSCCATRSGCC
jgi:catechol 2,3-dioxygenase-like lactoylglutathione lyase family enzyme